jgi:hypothetical protein
MPIAPTRRAALRVVADPKRQGVEERDCRPLLRREFLDDPCAEQVDLVDAQVAVLADQTAPAAARRDALEEPTQVSADPTAGPALADPRFARQLAAIVPCTSPLPATGSIARRAHDAIPAGGDMRRNFDRT